MKALKYLAVICLTSIFALSCEQEQGPSDQNKGKAKPVVTLTQGTATDGVLTFTIAADNTTSQYGFVLVEGKDNEAPVAYDIVVDEVSDVAESGVFNYADAASQEVSIECDSNTDYQIFAAAISTTGLVGEVVSMNVFVTDTVAPEIEYDEEDGYVFDFDESVLYLQYTEAVKYVEGKSIVATLYAGYSYDDTSLVPGYTITVIPYLVGTPVGTRTAKVATNASGVVQLNFGDMTPGTYYTISIPDGAFVDGAGNEAPGLTSKFNNPYFYKGYPAFVSTVENDVWGCTSNAPLTVVMPEATSVEDLSEWIEIGVPSMVQRVDNKLEWTTTIKHVEEVGGVKSETVTTYPMSPITHYGGDLYKFMVRPAGSPKPKDQITINIPAGACTDIYGNKSAAITVGPLSYAYTPVYPEQGDYTVNNGEYPFDARLVALTDDPEGPYLFYANWFDSFSSVNALPTLYLTLDEPSRTLTCNNQFYYSGSVEEDLFGTIFYYYDSAHTMGMAFYGGGDTGTEPITITYGEDGKLASISYCEYGVVRLSDGQYLGVYDSCDETTTFTKKESSAAPVANNKRVANFFALPEPQPGFAVLKK